MGLTPVGRSRCVFWHTHIQKALVKMLKLDLPVGFIVFVLNVGTNGTKHNLILIYFLNQIGFANTSATIFLSNRKVKISHFRDFS